MGGHGRAEQAFIETSSRAPSSLTLTASQKLCYFGPVKNITVTVPDDVYRQARIRAAERGRSLSALVREYLSGLAGRETEVSRLEAQQLRIQSEIASFRASDRLDRDMVHNRAVR